MRRSLACFTLAWVIASGAVGCGGREPIWEQPATVGVSGIQPLKGALAVTDDAAHRVLLLRPGQDQSLSTVAVPVGHKIATTAASVDGSKLFVLCQGDTPRQKPEDEEPSLTVIDASDPDHPKRFKLSEALTSLAIDPESRWVVAYAGDGTQGSFITNPNELAFIDLDPAGDPNPQPRTLPSRAGGYPKRITFTPKMQLPGGERRLLVIETAVDVLLLDLDEMTHGEITIPLVDARTDSRRLSPAAVAIDPGTPDSEPHIAVRTDQDDNVFLFNLGPASAGSPGGNDFVPTPNPVFVGGTPTDIAFVDTNQGKRLAVLVQAGQGAALLINPVDNRTAQAELPIAYQKMSLVTGLVSGANAGADQALLYGGGNAVALWDLGKVPDPSYSEINPLTSFETLTLDAAVGSVIDVPNTRLKVLPSGGAFVYVLDLDRHTASPLNTTAAVSLSVSRDGQRGWAFVPGTRDLARIDLSGPHVTPLLVDRIVNGAYEIERDDGGKALLAVHTGAADDYASGASRSAGRGGGAFAVTVFDALSPDPLTARRYSGLLLGGLLP